MPEKSVYTLTETGEKEFEKLMLEIAGSPYIFLDFNAVIVNLDSLSPKMQKECINKIKENIGILKMYLAQNLQEKENIPKIPKTGIAVLKQQMVLVNTIEEWISSLEETF